MAKNNYFRYSLQGEKEKFLDNCYFLLHDLYSVQKKIGTSNKEKKGFIDGFMHAGIQIGLVDMEELQKLIDQAHMDVFGKTLEERKTLIRSAQLSEDVLDIPTFYRLGKKIESGGRL